MKWLLIYLMKRRLNNAKEIASRYRAANESIFAQAHEHQADAYSKAILFLEAE